MIMLQQLCFKVLFVNHFTFLRLFRFTFCIFFFFVSYSIANVTYDSRSLIINGQRKLLISASIHYPRSVPDMWPGLIHTAKDGGVDAIETYVFWNVHEVSPDNYNFGGRYDLVKFVKTVQQAGLYLVLRIGPFVAAEWNYGGVPVWLHYIPGTIFRTNNEPFKHYMQKFTTFIVDMMKQENFFASQGGPIILAQIENEYGDTESVYGSGGKAYAMWAAQMALSQNISIPWIMCQQYDAPEHVINTCNSFYCDQFTPNSQDKPKMWTENWPGWFKTFGAPSPHRLVEDVAYSVARFFQKGGSFLNYYMYHGGTNFGRTAGGPFITTSYDYDAPIDEYGLPRLPKWGHLRDLHKAIKLCEKVLLNGDKTIISLGSSQEVDVYTDSSGDCVAFMANTDDKNASVVTFRNMSYHLPAWSVSILPDCKTVVFNTARVGSQKSLVVMIPENHGKSLKWETFAEKTGVWGEADFLKNGLVDHINTTKDTTDYLWYISSLYVDKDEPFLNNNASQAAVLLVESKGHSLLAFINNELQASGSGNGSHSAFHFQIPITLKAGSNEICLLSITVGLQNAGPFYESVGAGPTSVKITGFRSGTKDLSSFTWKYKIGLEGEKREIYKSGGLSGVDWVSDSIPPKQQPLTWYKAVIDSPPPGEEPVGLDMEKMGKGLAWLNGEEVGRYWPRIGFPPPTHDKCASECDYRGKFFPDKCLTGCGEPTQRWYHIPRSWFKPAGGGDNLLVVFEERGGDPTTIMFSRRKTAVVCAHVAEDHPSLEAGADVVPVATLECPDGSLVSSVIFSSFGDPEGMCGSFRKGTCHHPSSATVVETECLWKKGCRIKVGEHNFGKAPSCHEPAKAKSLAVQLQCS